MSIINYEITECQIKWAFYKKDRPSLMHGAEYWTTKKKKIKA